MEISKYKLGMVSVTFRKYSLQEVVRAAARAGLGGIEWGGDIHVPHGNTEAAEAAGRLTRESGLEAFAYGSYYRAGAYENAEEEYLSVLDTAESLGSRSIRIWAGKIGSAEVSVAQRRQIVAEVRSFAAAAKKRGLDIAFEYHQNTLTDSADSASRLIDEISCDNVRLYWQPNQYMDCAANLCALEKVVPYVKNVHVFAWRGSEKYPLSAHMSDWEKYLSVLERAGASAPRCLLLEFSPDGSEETFLSDAETLKALVM